MDVLREPYTDPTPEQPVDEARRADWLARSRHFDTDLLRQHPTRRRVLTPAEHADELKLAQQRLKLIVARLVELGGDDITWESVPDYATGSRQQVAVLTFDIQDAKGTAGRFDGYLRLFRAVPPSDLVSAMLAGVSPERREAIERATPDYPDASES